MQKRGFRLPWGAERNPDGHAGPDQLDANGEPQSDAARDDLGEGPFHLAGATQPTTDAVPAASDVPEQPAEAAMMDAENQTPPPAEAPPETGDGAWPVVDRRSADRPFVRTDPEPRMPRRDNPLVAGLVKAMREAAIASREETSARLQAEATARVEAIRARATNETADLRKRADDDVTGIREWSKAEIARIRQETEDRIEARKTELGGETQRHAASVDRLVDEVQTTVSVFEADMDRFFKRLLAEDDPARLATLAEQAPDPPDLRGDGPPAVADDALEASAAAEAEAEATEGLEDLSVETWPGAGLAAARRTDGPAATGAKATTPEPDANGPEATRLLVNGLTSVAGISAFKGALGQLPGVRSVSVSSGEPGMFVFAVSHDAGVDLDTGVASLTGFAAKITDATDDGFTVVAHEPAA
ncbi:MAG TPA: hypothetical protein VET90_00690 [Candidatus Binatus sp.]|nr:hypothetical protein [Candidatus Dormibacteraeota bacterium]HYL39803.1 hypothetical protein [Candidatus Binatus sp.]